MDYDDCIVGICSSFCILSYSYTWTRWQHNSNQPLFRRHCSSFSTILAIRRWLRHFYYCSLNVGSIALGVLHFILWSVCSNSALHFIIKIAKRQRNHIFCRSAVCSVRYSSGGDAHCSDVLQRFHCCMQRWIT